MITTRLGHKVPKWRLSFLGFSQAVSGWSHIHNWAFSFQGLGLSRSARTTVADVISGWGMADTPQNALNRKSKNRTDHRYRSGQDMPGGKFRKNTLSLVGSSPRHAVAALLDYSCHAPLPWSSLHYAGDQSSFDLVRPNRLKRFIGLSLLIAAVAPLSVSAEGRDEGESSLFVETFETLKQGYCYSTTSHRRWEWVMKTFCDSKGGVLLAKADCKKSIKQAGSTFCTTFRNNDRFKEASAEFKRKERMREARARKDNILSAKKILAALGFYQGAALTSSAFDDGLSRAIHDFLESGSVKLKGEPVYADALGRKHLSSALMEKLNEADQGYCFSPPYGKPQAVAAPRKGWCLKTSQERSARLSSVADCAADQGFLLPRDACRTHSGSTCKIFNFDAAAAVLRETEGEKEIHFASNATQCIDQGGLLISEKDCAEKSTTTTLLRQEYCRQIRAERLSAIKARWLAATGYCFLGKKPYSQKARSSCRDAGGIVIAPRHCGAFSGGGWETSSVCMSLNPAGDVYVKTELASRDAQATSVAKADKQPEEKNEGEADQALAVAEKKKPQQEVVGVVPLVGVWTTASIVPGQAIQEGVFLAIKSKGGGRYQALTWEKAVPVLQGIDGKWQGGKKCGGVETYGPFQTSFFLHIVDNKITHVASGGSSFTTTKISGSGISIKGHYTAGQRKYISYLGRASINSDGWLTLSGWRGPRKCTVSLQRAPAFPVIVKQSLRNLTLSKQADGRIRWDAISGAGDRVGYLEIVANAERPGLTAHGFTQDKKLSFLSIEQSRALGYIPPGERYAFSNMFVIPSDASQLAESSSASIPATSAAEFETSPKETPIATEQVIDLQKALAFFGLYKGSIDGDAGPNTQRAVNQWLKKQGRSLEEISRALIQEITTEAKVEKIRIANAEEKKQKAEKAKAEEIAKQKEREQRNQQLIALRSELLKDIVSARDLLGNHPGYPQKSDLETTINETIAILVLDDLEAMGAGKAVLLAAIQNLANYRDQQIALADAKKKEEAERQLVAAKEAEAKRKAEEEKQRQLAAAKEAEAKRKAEEEKQKAEKARLAEEQSKKASTNLATLSLEPMDKVFAVTEITNIRAAPKVLSDRVGRIEAGKSLTILAKVSGEHWYLVETDQGQRGFVFADVITLASGERKAAAKAKNPAIPDIDFGKYYALVIGNNAYRELPKLQSAISDARAVGALLENQYGFEVELLTNATRSEIFGSLSSMRRRIGSNENLLIYYAGHGWLDKEADEGYWMPIDAEEDNPSNWLSSANLISEIRRSKAKHILVVADSCFSGTLTRGLTIKSRTPDYLERIADKKARTALTSGGLEPVMDSGGESNHSVFASAFLGVLNDNDAVLDGHQLFTLVRKKVIIGSEQTPGYGDIRRAGHDGGDFLFVRQ